MSLEIVKHNYKSYQLIYGSCLKRGLKFCLFILFLSTLSCASMRAYDNHDWTKGTQGLSRDFNDMASYVFDETRYANPQYKLFILTNLKALRNNLNLLEQTMAQDINQRDPYTALAVKKMKSDIQRSIDFYTFENYSNSRNLALSSLISYIHCHQCSDSLAQSLVFNPASEMRQQNNHFLVSTPTEQYSLIENSLRKLLSSDDLKDEDKLFYLKLYTIINIKNSFFERSTISKINSLDVWFKDENLNQVFKSWKKFLKSIEDRTAYFNGYKETLFKTGERHFAENIYKMNILHKSLFKKLKPQNHAMIFEKLGDFYSSFDLLSIELLPETYYSSCIKRMPHSILAQKCYLSMEQRSVKAFARNKMSDLPAHEKYKLIELRSLAETKNIHLSIGGVASRDSY